MKIKIRATMPYCEALSLRAPDTDTDLNLGNSLAWYLKDTLEQMAGLQEVKVWDSQDGYELEMDWEPILDYWELEEEG